MFYQATAATPQNVLRRRVLRSDGRRVVGVEDELLDADAMAALRARFPALQGPKNDDICYATQNRQDAVKLLAPQVDVLVVVGSPTSSNSNRLRELAERLQRAADDFARQHLLDQKLPSAEKRPYSVVIGLRSWVFGAFRDLERPTTTR